MALTVGDRLVPVLISGGVLIGLTRVVPDKAWKVFLGLCAVAYIVMLGGRSNPRFHALLRRMTFPETAARS